MTVPPRDPVADELALRDLVNRYADAVSRHDARAVAELFVDDGEWEVAGYGNPRGHDAIAAFLASMLEGWTRMIHGLVSGRIVLDPTHHDRAHGRWYIVEFGQRADGVEVFFSGVYHDEYARDAGLWRFARRRYDSQFRRVGSEVTTSPFPADVDSA